MKLKEKDYYHRFSVLVVKRNDKNDEYLPPNIEFIDVDFEEVKVTEDIYEAYSIALSYLKSFDITVVIFDHGMIFDVLTQSNISKKLAEYKLNEETEV